MKVCPTECDEVDILCGGHPGKEVLDDFGDVPVCHIWVQSLTPVGPILIL